MPQASVPQLSGDLSCSLVRADGLLEFALVLEYEPQVAENHRLLPTLSQFPTGRDAQQAGLLGIVEVVPFPEVRGEISGDRQGEERVLRKMDPDRRLDQGHALLIQPLRGGQAVGPLLRASSPTS